MTAPRIALGYVVGALLWLALLACAGRASADELSVLVVVSDNLVETDAHVARLRSELRALGYQVSIVYQPSVASNEQLEILARHAGATAAIAVEESHEAVGAQVWMRDRAGERTLLRSVPPEPGGDQSEARFAIRTAELVVAGLIELGYPPRVAETGSDPAPSTDVGFPSPGDPMDPPPKNQEQNDVSQVEANPTSTTPPSQTNQHANPTDSPKLGIRVGGVGVLTPGGLPPTVAPVLGVSVRPRSPWVVDVVGWGPALSRVEQGRDSAHTDQEVLALRTGAEVAVSSVTQLYVVGGGGAYRLGVKGMARTEGEGVRDSLVSGLLGVGVGGRVRVTDTMALRGELAAWVTSKRPEVVFIDEVVARSGRPLVVLELAGEWGQ